MLSICLGALGWQSNPGPASAHLGVPHPFHQQHQPGEPRALSPATLPVKRSPPPGQGRGLGGGVGCAPRAISALSVSCPQGLLGGSGHCRRKAQGPAGRGQRPPKGRPDTGLLGVGKQRKDAAQVTSYGGALSQSGAKLPGALFPSLLRLEPSLTLRGSGAAPALWGPGPGFLPQTRPSYFCASRTEPRVRARGRTQARRLGVVGLRRLAKPGLRAPGAFRETTPRQGRWLGRSRIGLDLSKTTICSSWRPLLSLCF